MSKFFIRRPIFAWVISIVIMLGGALAISTLSISQYPEIAPPTIRISASYTGASADTVRKTVTQIIEDGMTGLDGLTYMNSSSTTGSASITLTFDNSVNGDIAQVQVQNKLQLVTSQLPAVVQDLGIEVTNRRRASCSSARWFRPMESARQRSWRHFLHADRRPGETYRRCGQYQCLRFGLRNAYLARPFQDEEISAYAS